jgi:hypothetical protein
MNSAQKAYDNWLTTDVAAEEAAIQEMRIEKIRDNLSIGDYLEEIKEAAMADKNCCDAIDRIFCGDDFDKYGKVLWNFSQKWLDNKAEELAAEGE